MFLLLLLLEHRACDDHRMLLHTHRRQRHYDLCLQPAHHRQPLGARRKMLPSPFPSAESGQFPAENDHLPRLGRDGQNTKRPFNVGFCPLQEFAWMGGSAIAAWGWTDEISDGVCFVQSSPVQSSPVPSLSCQVLLVSSSETKSSPSTDESK